MLIENTETIIQICKGIFDESRGICLLLVGPVFFAKVFWLNISGASSADYSELIKGLLLFLVLSYSFEYVLEFVFEIPKALEPGMTGLGARLADSNTHWAPDVLRWVVESVGLAFYYIAHFVQFLFLVLLCSLGPILFLLGCLLGLGFSVKVFFGILLVTGCWPIVWMSFNEVGDLIASLDLSWMGYAMSEILINFMKAVGPLGLALAAFSSEAGKSVRRGVSGAKTLALTAATLGRGGVVAGASTYARGKFVYNHANEKYGQYKRGRDDQKAREEFWKRM
jgi:hypothetical protein